MPHLLPETPALASSAEQAVWERLRDQLPEDATVIAGQRITAHGHEIEIDLLVLWPDVGTAVIEVKGGRVGVEDGTWLQSDRHGAHPLQPSPVEQAQRAKHELVRYLNATSSRVIGRSAHLVALPYTQLPADWDVPDAPREIVLDSTDMARLPERIAEALHRQEKAGYIPLDSDQRDHAVAMLRRTHRAIESVRLTCREIEDRSNQLTREQELAIGMLRFQHRAQIMGGAGSGKTHLAMIKARTLARDGFRTALMCYSRGLARYFQLLSSTWPEEERPAFVGLFHDLPVHWGVEAVDEFGGDAVTYYEHHLPQRLADVAREQNEDQLFDAIVVDEGQDFADAWWDGLLPCLRDEATGVLFVFTDEHQSVFDREGVAPITLNPFPLDDNLRSTARIARTFAPLTPIEQTPRLDEGEPVRYVRARTSEAISAADDAVEQLLAEGWEPGDIALLTTRSRHPEQIARIEHAGHDGYWDEYFSGEDVFYGHVLNFKGLERRVVVLAVNGFHSDERAPHLLYVGLSRARSLLVVVGDPGEIWDAGGDEVWQRISGGADA